MSASTDKARQVMEETQTEHETRSKGHFPKVEGLLSQRLGSRFNISLADNMCSYLGFHNPFAKEVDSATECVWLLDNTAYRPVHIYPHRKQPFQAEYVAAYFKRNSGKDVSQVVAEILDRLGPKGPQTITDDTANTIAYRLQPFVDTIAPSRYVNVGLPNQRVEKLGPGGRSAVSSQTIVALQEHRDGESVEVRSIPSEILPHGGMTTYFADVEGWLVISDIDDSIKVTMTPSPIGILESTFIDNPTPIAGMPALYSQIHALLHPAWFYLSASPYNLYPFLREFLHAHYPKGPIMLRDASWMDLSGLLASLTQGTETYKRDRMIKIHQWLPKRKVICVGDSTQTDPEAYGDICRKFPGWVRAVYIRKVTDVAEMKGTDKNEDERFEKAFEGVDRGVWRTFVDPSELEEAVGELKEV